MPENKKPLSKQEIERRAQKVKDANLKRQRNFSQGAGKNKRKVATKVPTSTYVPIEREVNEIKPQGVKKTGPFAKLGQRDKGSTTTFREDVINPIMKYIGGK